MCRERPKISTNRNRRKSNLEGMLDQYLGRLNCRRGGGE